MRIVALLSCLLCFGCSSDPDAFVVERTGLEPAVLAQQTVEGVPVLARRVHKRALAMATSIDEFQVLESFVQAPFAVPQTFEKAGGGVLAMDDAYVLAYIRADGTVRTFGVRDLDEAHRLHLELTRRATWIVI